MQYDLTVKLYFCDTYVENLSEVVSPHDHRYDFDTFVVAGEYTDFTYREDANGEVFERFEYRTPMLGGDGFTWSNESRLAVSDEYTMKAGDLFSHQAENIHTIRINQAGTVLCLMQYSDRHGLDFTQTFMKDRKSPNLDGLYEKFTVDQVKKRLEQIGLKGMK